MSSIKWLEKKIVIQVFGLGLFLSPFVNFFMMFALMKRQTGLDWSQLPYKQILQQGQPVKYALAIGSLFVGIIMLRGSQKAWHYAMGLLTGYILNQIPTIGYDMRVNWLWGPVFLMNCILLFLIADQLVFKNPEFSLRKNTSKKDIPIPSTSPLASQPQLNLVKDKPKPINSFVARRNKSKSYQFDFLEENSVGEVFDLNDLGFKIRLQKPVSGQIGQRKVEISFDRRNYRKAQVEKVLEDSIQFKFVS